jgi:hypothetical protein
VRHSLRATASIDRDRILFGSHPVVVGVIVLILPVRIQLGFFPIVVGALL